MQSPQCIEFTQLPLFQRTILGSQSVSLNRASTDYPWAGHADAFSELTVQGTADNCLLLLSPIIRALSERADYRWLTLINAPSQLTRTWLRSAGFKRETILLLPARGEDTALELACKALRLGRSHTVISWINPLEDHSRQMLTHAALEGQTQCLNIRLG